MYVYDLDNLRSGVTVRYAIRFDTHPNIIKVMRDANLVTLSTSSTRTLFGKKSWQKLRENEGEIGYFLVKFGVELWGGIFN